MHETDPVAVTILRELIAADGSHRSGESLGETLGCSRVSIRNKIQQLTDADFQIEAIRRKGYRLVALPPSLDALALRALLEMTTPLYFLDTTDSTNSEAERRLASGAEAPFVVVAARQTAGRGRLGRKWESADLGNLYLSAAFRPHLPPSRMSLFTLWMGLSLCRELSNEYRVPLKVKWPNDLLLEGRKVAGMLTEARIDADRTRDLIFGIGLNITGDVTAFPEALRTIATTLQSATSTPLNANRVTAFVVTSLLTAYEQFMAGIPTETFPQHWQAFCALTGSEVSVRGLDRELSGKVMGINGQGQLLLKTSTGQQHALHAGEVSLSRGAGT